MNNQKPTILFPIEADMLWEKIGEVVRNEMKNWKGNVQEPVKYEVSGMVQKPLYKAAEVCAMLQISRQTLHMWVKEGILRAYKIKSRVFFLWADIEKLIQKQPQ